MFHRKKKSHRFGMTWGWYMMREFHIFLRTIPLSVCVCYALNVALCGKVWVWLNMCVKMYMCVTMCVSRRRSEPFCLSWLALILFSGLKPFFFWVANRHDTCTHADAHTLFSYLHTSSLPTAKKHHKLVPVSRIHTHTQTHTRCLVYPSFTQTTATLWETRTSKVCRNSTAGRLIWLHDSTCI